MFFFKVFVDLQKHKKKNKKHTTLKKNDPQKKKQPLSLKVMIPLPFVIRIIVFSFYEIAKNEFCDICYLRPNSELLCWLKRMQAPIFKNALLVQHCFENDMCHWTFKNCSTFVKCFNN